MILAKGSDLILELNKIELRIKQKKGAIIL